jgi:hypothetical protein
MSRSRQGHEAGVDINDGKQGNLSTRAAVSVVLCRFGIAGRSEHTRTRAETTRTSNLTSAHRETHPTRKATPHTRTLPANTRCHAEEHHNYVSSLAVHRLHTTATPPHLRRTTAVKVRPSAPPSPAYPEAIDTISVGPSDDPTHGRLRCSLLRRTWSQMDKLAIQLNCFHYAQSHLAILRHNWPFDTAFTRCPTMPFWTVVYSLTPESCAITAHASQAAPAGTPVY